MRWPSRKTQQRQDQRSPDSTAEADARARAALASRRRVDVALPGRLRRRRDRPHPGVHRQGGGADLLQRRGARRGHAVEDVVAPQLWPGYDEAASIWQPVSEIPKFGIWPLIVGTVQGHDRRDGGLGTARRGRGALRLAVRAPADARDRQAASSSCWPGIPSVVLGFFALMVMATWFQNLLRPRVAPQRAGLGRRAVVRRHPGDLHAVRGGAARRPAQLRRGLDRARRGALADDRCGWCCRRPAPASRPASRSGLGRAVGETMIVLMASGNAAIVSANLADSARTISATIAAELAEVVFGGAHYTVLFFLGTLLFLDDLLHQHRRRLDDPPHEDPSGRHGVSAAAGSRSASKSTLAQLAVRRTRRNFVADGAMADRLGRGAAHRPRDPRRHPVRRRPQRRAAPLARLSHRGAARGHDRGRDLPRHRRHGRDGHPHDAGGRAGRASRPRSICTSTRSPSLAGDARRSGSRSRTWRASRRSSSVCSAWASSCSSWARGSTRCSSTARRSTASRRSSGRRSPWRC